MKSFRESTPLTAYLPNTQFEKPKDFAETSIKASIWAKG
jgi:hypothetical protein